MKKSYKGWITVLGFAGAVFLSACNSTSTQVKEISIIPLPNSIVETSSAFVLPEKCTIGVTDKSLIPREFPQRAGPTPRARPLFCRREHLGRRRRCTKDERQVKKR